MALPLGCTSEGDLLDLHLEEPIAPEALHAALQDAVPPGLEVESVRSLPASEPKLQKRIQACEYQIPLGADTVGDELSDRVAALLESAELPRERAGKCYDLRPLIEALQIQNDPGERVAMLSMRLVAREGATGRPDEVLRALGLDPAEHIAHRRRILLD